MENKKVQIEMYDSSDKKVKVLFEIKPMRNRWEYTEIVSDSKAKFGNNDFKLAFDLSKKLFPKMVVSPKFEILKKIDENTSIDIETQIKEYFFNDPQALMKITTALMGLMERN